MYSLEELEQIADEWNVRKSRSFEDLKLFAGSKGLEGPTMYATPRRWLLSNEHYMGSHEIVAIPDDLCKGFLLEVKSLEDNALWLLETGKGAAMEQVGEGFVRMGKTLRWRCTRCGVISFSPERRINYPRFCPHCGEPVIDYVKESAADFTEQRWRKFDKEVRVRRWEKLEGWFENEPAFTVEDKAWIVNQVLDIYCGAITRDQTRVKTGWISLLDYCDEITRRSNPGTEGRPSWLDILNGNWE